jgi:hypothetical protein
MSEPENLAGRGGGVSRLGHLSGIVPRYWLHFHNPIMEGLPTTRNSDNIARLDEPYKRGCQERNPPLPL